jgi:acyl transferase domain-containing protein/NADPH:quinone reductase-like Zn-dependent oxidoreductase/SAM-dependent methyltransferase/acyl carrier protein
VEQQGPHEPIALVGIGCRFPGGADNPSLFWRLLRDGVDAITEIPAERGDPRVFFGASAASPGRSSVRWGGFVDSIDRFDPEFFGISLREAPCVDPQQRMLLEAAWEALEDGGEVLDERISSKTGVFVGISTNDYQQLQANLYDHSLLDVHTVLGCSLSIAANRISYSLNLHGPSIALDTACSSSLVAVHLACRSLWNQECDLALAGGVNALLSPGGFLQSMLSPDGRCKAFDSRANGFVRAEGVGMVLLKRLSAALADGNPVYAVVRGTAMNQDGRTPGITVPNAEAQAALIREACRVAGARPEEIYYVEAHGTGTAVGDPIEAHALGTALGNGRSEANPCVVGSVKTNIGHLEAAAGVAGLIKVALMFQHRQIPPNLHLVEPNPRIDFRALKLRVPVAMEVLPSGPIVAGINSFGFGGVNAHAVLESWEENGDSTSAPSERKTSGGTESFRPRLLPLSARCEESLVELARRYSAFLGEQAAGGGDAAAHLRDACYTASLRRKHHDHRLAVVGESPEDLADKLEAFARGEARRGTSGAVADPKRKLVFVFGGQGPQWWGMARQLLHQEPVFRQSIEECDRILRLEGGWSLLEELHAVESASRLQVTAIAQPAIFSIQVALAALWKSWGIEPDAVVGHSVGEVAAAYVSGVMDLETAARVIFHRGRCMDLAPQTGRMLAAGVPENEALDLVASTGGRVSVAAINSPRSVTLSGEADALAGIAEVLQRRSTFCRLLSVNYAFHSAHMEPVREELLASLRHLTPGSPRVPMWSTVTGETVDGEPLDATYWWRNVRNPVRFSKAAAALVKGGHHVFLELGPHPVLTGSIAECLEEAGVKGTVTASLRRGEDDVSNMMAALGTLYAIGFNPNWERVFPEGGRCIRLPRYPWRRQRYWQETEDIAEARHRPPDHPLLGRAFQSANPTWETKIGSDLGSLLANHRVQGRTVFPAAAFLEMALGAGKRLFGTDSCVLEEVDIQKPLFLPDTGEPPRLQFIYDPRQKEFSISSLAGDVKKFWILHCTGRLLPGQDRLAATSESGVPQAHGPEIPGSELYGFLGRMGFQYGPAFQLAQTIWCGPTEAVGTIELPGGGDDEGYQIHPAFLDACFHVVLGLGTPGSADSLRSLYLPARFKRIRFYSRPSRLSRSQVRLVRRSSRYLEVDVRVFDAEDGGTSLELDGFTLLAVEGARSGSDEGLESSLYEMKWQLQGLPVAEQNQSFRHFLPEPHRVAPSLREEAYRRTAKGWLPRFRELEADIDHLCARYVLRAFEELGCRFEAGEAAPLEALRTRIAPQHRRLLERYLRLLERDGVLVRVGDDWRIGETLEREDPEHLWRSLFRKFPAYLPELTGIGTFGRSLARILCDEVDALGLLFGETSFIEQFYTDSVTFRDSYHIIQRVMDEVVSRLPEGRKLRIVELGAGTGGLTSSLLSRLPPGQTEFLFTDVSPHFLGKAEQRFRLHPWIHYRSLDLERDPLEQGLGVQEFDVVLASEVLHATSDLRRTLRHVKQLLAPGGLLVALELDTPPRWVDLVFALTKGWWSFSDRDLRTDSPLLGGERWVEVLGEEGFVDPAVIAESDGARKPIQCVLLGRGPEGQSPAENVKVEPPGKAAGRWLLFADDGVAETLAADLGARGGSCLLVFTGTEYERGGDGRFRIRPAVRADFRRVLDEAAAGDELRGVVFLWGLEGQGAVEPTLAELESAQVRGCESLLALLQELEANPIHAPLWLVTRGTQPAGREGCRTVAQAPLWGLGRAVMNELPRLSCRMVDLSTQGGHEEVSCLVAELVSGDEEDEVALRGSSRYVPRLVHGTCSAPAVVSTGVTTPYRLEITRPGVLDDLRLRPLERRPPGPGEVEIEVEAASLNFRDVMKALGIYPRELEDSLRLGDECSGTIVAVGPDVAELRIGQEVTAFASSCLSTHVIASTGSVLPRPRSLRPEEAVTIPVAFITATFTLNHLAQLGEGERVLIHSAAGGVGLAAVQVALLAGAEIFATAGSPRKRSLLRQLGVPHVMDSRSLAFADEVMQITNGEGVDVVLNSLAGDALVKGMSLLRPNGRFVEIGKRDIFQNSKLGLRLFRNGNSFQVFDLVTAVPTQPEIIRRLWLQVYRDLDAGRLFPLPTRLFPMGDVAGAFRCMMEGAHTGKIVFRLNDGEVPVQPLLPDLPPCFREDATYLMTGGFGGFSLAIAQWMVENGARHLVLAGRSGASTDEARRIVGELRRKARVVEAQMDVTKEHEVAGLLRRIDQTMPPLRGIMHGAMVLDDGVVLQLNQDRLRKVMAPKVLGAWNLHRLTAGRTLDFFVTHSSFTSMTGNPGQGNYAAANAFLDSLVHYRRSRGLPGLSVNWGSIQEVGYIARTGDLSESLARLGVRGIRVATALQMLGRLLRSDTAQMGVMAVDWGRLVEYIAALRLTPRFSVVLAAAAAGPEKVSGGGRLRERILDSAAAERRELVLAFLREHAAKVLRTSPMNLDIEKPMTELGLDSLMAVELSNRLESELGVVLPMGRMTAGQSVVHLAELLLEVLSAPRAQAAGVLH